MRTPLVASLALAAGLFAGCCQGPGYTRAAGTIAGTATGAFLGAAASPCDRGGGALVGGTLGLVAGTLAGDAIAQDQECPGCLPPVHHRRCSDCQPRPLPRRTVIRRRVYIVEDGVERPADEVIEEVEVPPPPPYGYGHPGR